MCGDEIEISLIVKDKKSLIWVISVNHAFIARSASLLSKLSINKSNKN